MKTILLTGFEPFLEYPVNPTMKIVEELNGKVIGDYEVAGRILPVDFANAGSRLLEEIEQVQPDAIVSLGLAGGRSKLTPERVAINIKDGDSDNHGNRPVDEPIAEEGEPAYFSTLPIRAMVERLKEKGLPAAISNTAGTYLCNMVMYEGLRYAANQAKPIVSGFLHLPASHELALQHGRIPSWPHEDLLRAVEICLAELTDS